MIRIISGGQTGVDRAAMDAALQTGTPCSGWCPHERRAEDGPIAEYYPMTTLTAGGYRERSLRNVLDSDGTLLIYFGELSGGSRETLEFCIWHQKPYKLIDGLETDPTQALDGVVDFLRRNDIRHLNVAGPRASEAREGYAYTLRLMRQVLAQSAESASKPAPRQERAIAKPTAWAESDRAAV